MITTKEQLRDVLKYEKQQYANYMYRTPMRSIMAMIKHEPTKSIWRWQKASRKTDYYHYKVENDGSVIDKIKYIYNIILRNRRAEKLGIEIDTTNTEKGFFLYHIGATVINGSSVIGENCHLHGNNCIGNGGPHDLRCPVIGNNVMIGVGAKIIGNVKIADNIKIAAGAVVVHSFTEPGITIAGIPAKKVSK